MSEQLLREALQTAIWRIEDILKADDGQAYKEAEKALPKIKAALAQPAEGGEVQHVHVYNVTKTGSLCEWEPTAHAFAMPDGKHALYTTPPAGHTQGACRSDGRCQYAIDHGAEGLGACPPGKCAMPTRQDEAVALTGCNCRWKGETQVEWCEHHRAHLDAIHEWAQRAKAAESKLKASQEQAEPTFVPNTFKLPGESDDAWLDRITGATPAEQAQQPQVDDINVAESLTNDTKAQAQAPIKCRVCGGAGKVEQYTSAAAPKVMVKCPGCAGDGKCRTPQHCDQHGCHGGCLPVDDPQAQAQELPDERAAFEAWAKKHSAKIGKDIDGDYLNLGTQCAWLSWQARAALAAKQERKPMTEGDA